MLNINAAGRNNTLNHAGQMKNPGVNSHDNKHKEKSIRNTDLAEFKWSLEQTRVSAQIKTVSSAEQMSGLSKAAQSYLQKLKGKYSDMDFIIADFSTEEEADKLLEQGTAKYTTLISPSLLEKMAADENTAAKYEDMIDKSVESIDSLREGLGEDADMVRKFGVTFDKDGNMSLRAKLIGGLTAADGSDTVKASTVEEMLDELKKTKESQYDKLEKIRSESKEKAEEERVSTGGRTVADSGKADMEIRELKVEIQTLTVKIRAEANEDKRTELERMLDRLSDELAMKDNEGWRRQHTSFSTEA